VFFYISILSLSEHKISLSGSRKNFTLQLKAVEANLAEILSTHKAEVERLMTESETQMFQLSEELWVCYPLLRIHVHFPIIFLYPCDTSIIGFSLTQVPMSSNHYCSATAKSAAEVAESALQTMQHEKEEVEVRVGVLAAELNQSQEAASQTRHEADKYKEESSTLQYSLDEMRVQGVIYLSLWQYWYKYIASIVQVISERLFDHGVNTKLLLKSDTEVNLTEWTPIEL